MTPADTTLSAKAQSEITDGDKHWPASMVFLTAWLMPATTTLRTNHVSLKRAYTVHIIAALITFMLIMFFIAWDEADEPVTFLGILDTLASNICGLFEIDPRFQKESILIILSTILLIEIGFIVLALLVTPWGAEDEPIGTSFTHALRQTWLHTTHAITAVLLIGVLLIPIYRAQRHSWQTHVSSLPQPPQQPINSQAWKDYQVAVMQYQQQTKPAREKYLRNLPWYSKYDEEIHILPSLAVSTWILWALLSAVGVNRKTKPIDRPPMCERCGYNLTATPMDSRCPECGRSVLQSLGVDTRRGTLWQQRNTIGRFRAWWRCNLNVIFRPKWLGQQIQLRSFSTDHHRFLVIHLVSIFFISFIGGIGIILSMAAAMSMPLPEVRLIVIISILLGYLTAVAIIAIVLLSAGLIGLIYQIKDKRNLLNGSVQIACYLSGYLVLWTIFAAFVVMEVFIHMDKIQQLNRMIRLNMGPLMLLVWFLPNLLCLIGYWLLIAKGTSAARYANR
ncbi:MAG: hypothetical protein JSV03_13465 [Planctomycetota bacterium]|nr:MAG: hypothetical protein JSV03_13465 [Planctomycetota bacterium]